MTESQAKPQPKPKSKPTAEEIQALRQARAAKKAEQQIKEQKAKEEALNGNITNPHLDKHGKQLYQPRQWTKVKGCEDKNGVRIVSWNMLAQGLVRRKLFPGSDCLKWKDREAGLSSELIGHHFDVGLFQEVDRIDSHSKTLSDNGFNFIFEKGYKTKQHGLMIAWRSQTSRKGICFEEQALETKVIYLDDLKVKNGSSEQNQHGSCEQTYNSRVTRNVALFAAIKFKDLKGNSESKKSEQSKGLILATTHLFWHPKHPYERVRQVGVIVQALNEFRNQRDSEWKGWPVVFAGDFNDQPHSATYQLLTGKSYNDLDKHALEEIEASSVVHQSVDEKRKKSELTQTQAQQDGVGQDVAGEAQEEGEEEFEEEEDDEEEEDEEEEQASEGGQEKPDDQMLKNCRSAQPGELLSAEQLAQLYILEPGSTSSLNYLLSSYDSANSKLVCSETATSNEENFFSSKSRGRERFDDETYTPGQTNSHSLSESTKDSKEPMWTLYSSLFGLTLDYIFLFPKLEAHNSERKDQTNKEKGFPKVLSLLPTHETKILEPGVPRLRICASDHVLIGAEIEID